MYSKLGDLLKSAIENENLNLFEEKQDKFSEENNSYENSNQENLKEKLNKSKNHDENTINNSQEYERIKNILKKEKKLSAEVVKVYKYTENIQFPPEIQNALNTLDIAYPFTFHDIKKKYHELLKTYHPDVNTIQNTQDVKNNRHLDINTIIDSYNLLDSYFNV